MKFVPGVLVHANEKGWMNESLTQEWLRMIWNKRPQKVAKQKSMLVWDSFRAHISEPVKVTATASLTDLNAILKGKFRPRF